MFSARVRVGLAGLVLMLCATVASAQNLTPTLSAVVNGGTVTLSWTPVDGATGYEVFAQAGGSLLGPLAVSGTSTDLPGIPPGQYFAAVRGTNGALKGPFSSIVPITVVGTPPPPPPPPSNFAAIVSNNDVALTWTVPAGVANVFLQAGSVTGGSDFGTFPLGTDSSLFLPSLPSDNYFLRLYSLGVGGPSAPSTELTVVTPGCIAPAVLPFTATGQGFVELSWPQVPGAVGYRLDVGNTPAGGAALGSFPFGPATTSFTAFDIAEGDYYLTLHTSMSCGASASSAVTLLKVTAPVRLPARSRAGAGALVASVAGAVGRAFPGDLRRSCGNNTWLFRLLQRLRQIDNRFGLNWKRGNVGDLSQDVITYNHSEVPDEQATARSTYGWDVIGGHCGGSPRAQASDITNPNGSARWTIQPYRSAGFAP